jgi:hypothetical protein
MIIVAVPQRRPLLAAVRAFAYPRAKEEETMQPLKRIAATLIISALVSLGAGCDRGSDRAPSTAPRMAAPRADLAVPSDATEWLARALSLGELLSDDPRMTAWTDEAEDDDVDPIHVVPFEFDPGKTYLVRARWLRGTGCPTGSDPACASGDSKDNKNEGLLLVKTGSTANNASAGAEVKGVNGITLNELGYDVRKPISPLDPRGSHCGAGAPRFNVVTTDGVNHFVGCNSPTALFTSGPGWVRLRWTATELALAFPAIPPGSVVKSIAIVFDEGQDAGPDNFGLAVLDNIDVNGQLVGQGPGN